jgi:hypothetical protein
MDNSNYKTQWGKISNKSDEDLKQIAMDLYNNLIFCDRQCDDHMILSVFMVVALMGPQSPEKPTIPSSDNVVENRDIVADYIGNEEELLKAYKKDKKLAKKAQKYYEENFLSSIGLIYEFITEAGPRSINGLPMFTSVKFLNREDASKMFEHFNLYREVREKVDSF